MKFPSLRFARSYGPTLRKHLRQDGHASPAPVLRLGREAIAGGLKTRDLARIHERALVTLPLPGKLSGTEALVHRFARELPPAVLDDLGLIPALHSFMKSFTERSGVRTRLTAFAGVESLNMPRRTALFRVAQEALTNVGRHAKASRVDVSILKRPDGARMKIADDGKSCQA